MKDIRGPGNFCPEGEPSAVSIKWEECLEEDKTRSLQRKGQADRTEVLGSDLHVYVLESSSRRDVGRFNHGHFHIRSPMLHGYKGTCKNNTL